MTLVERLRSRSAYLHGSSAEQTMEAAASEIERLTAENKRLTALLQEVISDTDMYQINMDLEIKIKAALETKP